MNLLPVDDIELQFEIVGLAKHYGLRHQLLKLCEELKELDEAVKEHIEHPTTYTKEHITEEIADVEVMIAQAKYLLSIADKSVRVHKAFKVFRQKDRIVNEELCH